MSQQPPKQNDLTKTIEKINELYITSRRKYLVQSADGYITLNKYNNDNVWTLNDGMIKRHLVGHNTYGVFNASSVNKFITFDIDYEDDDSMARWATMKLIDVLVRDFNILAQHVHASISGGKGYHVDLFFDRTLNLETVETFYRNVLKVADLPSDKVEFRPSYAQGVKLPLGIHQRTKRRCWFVDIDTLEPIKSFDYLNDVEPMPAEIIEEGAIVLTEEQEAEFREIVEKTDTSITIVSAKDAYKKALKVLSDGRLTVSNSRHSTTLLLASFFNSQGYEEQDAIDCIMSVLHNTPREYFSKDSTPEHWQKEAERIVGLAFDRDYKLGNEDRAVIIYKSEILAVLGVGTFRQKQVAYAMLVTSKRYGKTFYLTMNKAMEMIGTNSRETVQNAIKKLVEREFIEYIRKGEIDKARSAELGRAHYKPNTYRLLINQPEKGERSVEVTDSQSLVDVAYLLCEVEEMKSYIGRKEFSNRWQRAE